MKNNGFIDDSDSGMLISLTFSFISDNIMFMGEAIRELFDSPAFLKSILETMSDGLMVVDRNGQIVFFNRAAETITGYRADEVIGTSCATLDTSTCTLNAGFGKERKCKLFEAGCIQQKRCQIRSKDGRAIHLLKNAVVLRNAEGEAVGAVEVMTDLTPVHEKELEVERLRSELMQEYGFMGLIGTSLPMQRLYAQIQNAAATEAPIVITGESGTGKELVAGAIHRLSRRQKGPFITVNCAALNEYLLESELFGHVKGSFTGAVRDRQGRFEAAHHGSLFLDEIGDMPLPMQVKLLRVLQEKEIERVGDQRPVKIDVRLMSATNRNMEELLRDGGFREDLYYRINVIPLHVPPLRERTEDIPLLVSHYLERIGQVNRKNIAHISPTALDAILTYHWPGNVRQLINTLEYAAMTAQGNTVEPGDLPDYLLGRENVLTETRTKSLQREEILSALARTGWHRTRAARQLGISRVTLWKLIKELKLAPED